MSFILNTLSDPRLVSQLKDGKVGIMPSDTIYGLMCRAGDEQAVARLYKLKAREHKPGTVISANIDQLIELGVKARYLKAVEQFWPNAISIEIPHSITYLSQSTGRQAFRIINGPAELLGVLQKTGPLLTSSANQPGQPPANTIDEARQYFGDTIDFYTNGGDLSGHKPSTLIRIIDDAVEVLRPGAVTIDESTGRVI